MNDKKQSVAAWYAQNHAVWVKANDLEEHYRTHLELDVESMRKMIQRKDSIQYYLSNGIKKQEIDDIINLDDPIELKKFVSLVIVELKKIFPVN